MELKVVYITNPYYQVRGKDCKDEGSKRLGVGQRIKELGSVKKYYMLEEMEDGGKERYLNNLHIMGKFL